MLLLLGSREFYAADLWTLTLVGGTVLRYCSGDADITANGLLYSAGGQVGPYFDRSDNKAKCHWSVGTSVDTLTVDVIPGSSVILGDPFLQAIHDGILDGAEVMLERAYMPTYGDTRYGVIRMFVGRIADIDSASSLVTLSITSHLELLNLQFPRNLVQTSCVNNLGDSTCGVALASFSTTGVINGTPTANEFTATLGGTFAAGSFDLGTLTFTSGVLSGFKVSVLGAALVGTAADITTGGPLPEVPAPGDTFTIYYGCNKSLTDANGCPKFSNTARFRGFPFVPQPTVAV